MTSYVTEYASGARSSRVAATARTYGRLAIAAMLSDDDAPSFVHLDPSGTRVALRYPTSLLLLDQDRRIGDGSFRGITYVAEWGAILGAIDMRWDGLTYEGHDSYQERIPTYGVKLTSGYQLAARLSGARWTSVGQETAVFGTEDEIRIYSRAQDGTVWMDVVPGRGAAAIGDDDRVILATNLGRVLVYAPDGGTGDLRGSPRSNLEIGEPLQFVSAMPAGCAVASTTTSSTHVHFVTERGVAWSADVPFLAHQPPVDGSDGRIYVAGDGLAAIDRGSVKWSTPSLVTTRATAFGDGTLAVCRGPGLQIIARDGSPIQLLMTSDGAAIVTPPAIGPDGTIWVATATHLYVTR